MDHFPLKEIYYANKKFLIIACIVGAIASSLVILKKNGFQFYYYQASFPVTIDKSGNTSFSPDTLMVSYSNLLTNTARIEKLYSRLKLNFPEMQNWNLNDFLDKNLFQPTSKRYIQFTGGYDNVSLIIKIRTPIFLDGKKFKTLLIQEINRMIDESNFRELMGKSEFSKNDLGGFDQNIEGLSSRVEDIFSKQIKLQEAIGAEKYRLIPLFLKTRSENELSQIINFFSLYSPEKFLMDSVDTSTAPGENFIFSSNHDLSEKLFKSLFVTQELFAAVSQSNLLDQNLAKEITQNLVKYRIQLNDLNTRLYKLTNVNLLMNGIYTSSTLLPNVIVLENGVASNRDAFENITILNRLIAATVLGGAFAFSFSLVIVSINYFIRNGLGEEAS